MTKASTASDQTVSAMTWCTEKHFKNASFQSNHKKASQARGNLTKFYKITERQIQELPRLEETK